MQNYSDEDIEDYYLEEMIDDLGDGELHTAAIATVAYKLSITIDAVESALARQGYQIVL